VGGGVGGARLVHSSRVWVHAGWVHAGWACWWAACVWAASVAL